MTTRNPWLMPAGTDGLIPVQVLWERLLALYGEDWRSRFADDAARVGWQQEAAAVLYARGVRYTMVKQALAKLAEVRSRDRSALPPATVVELADLCLPLIDFEAAFDEARTQAPLDELGMAQWSSPAVYWAARDFGLRRIEGASWSRNKSEWMRVLTNRLAGQICPPIPAQAPREALPHKRTEVGIKALEGLRSALGLRGEGTVCR